jgi:hypothetical protein
MLLCVCVCVLAAVGRLCLIDARRLNNAATCVHFDLSSRDPARIMVKPGKAPQSGDTFFELLRIVAPCLPILGQKINHAGINRRIAGRANHCVSKCSQHCSNTKLLKLLNSIRFPCQANLLIVFSGALKPLPMRRPSTRRSICSYP